VGDVPGAAASTAIGAHGGVIEGDQAVEHPVRLRASQPALADTLPQPALDTYRAHLVLLLTSTKRP
jgi:hypothetical protein